MRGEEVRVKMHEAKPKSLALEDSVKKRFSVFFSSQETRTYVTAEENKLQRARSNGVSM